MNDSLSYQYGIGAFETIRVIDGKPEYLDWHLDRLADALQVIGLNEYTKKTCQQLIIGEIKAKLLDSGVIKLIVSDQGMTTHVRKNPYSEAHYKNGFKVMISDVELPVANRYTLKSTNYLINYLEWQRAKSMGYDEMLFLNGKKNLVEATRSNLFAICNGVIMTPPLESGCLSGIMRRVIIEMSGKQIKIVNFDRDMLKRAEAVFLTNSVMGVMPVSQFEEIVYDSMNHTEVKKLMKLYNGRWKTNG
jgi:4-amino-4-deoxychorismate lyase